MINPNSQQPNSNDKLGDLARQIVSLSNHAAAIYEPMVDAIVESHSKDVRQIEYVLDYLLGFAGSEKCLVLFKKLCRHYWFIDPNATADYVGIYREMYDDDDSAELNRPSATSDSLERES